MTKHELTDKTKSVALKNGADLVGVSNVSHSARLKNSLKTLNSFYSGLVIEV